MTSCQGCGADLPPKTRRRGRERKWCSERCRKSQYGAACVDCSVTTNGSDGYTGQSARCAPCRHRYRHETRQWTRDAILAAIWQWADEHGGVPPVATDWNGAKTAETAGYPSPTLVMREFGTWNAGLREAGFDTFAVGHYGREGEDPAIVAESVRLYRSGLSLAQVGERMGVSAEAIRARLLKVGEPRRPAHRPTYERVAA